MGQVDVLGMQNIKPLEWSVNKHQLFLPQDLPRLLSFSWGMHTLSEDFCWCIFSWRREVLELGTNNIQVRMRFDCIQQQQSEVSATIIL